MTATVHWKCDCCGVVEERGLTVGRPEHWHSHGVALAPAAVPEAILICTDCQKALGEFLLERRKEFARQSDTVRVGKPIP
jgi:hypothetical protein